MPKQIAVWNTDLKLWTKPSEVLFSEHLELFSGTWPTSGMTQSGVAYELVMQVPHTSVSESLLLRTPIAGEAAGGAVAPEVAKARNQTLRLSGQMIDLVAPDQLPKLPTPTVSDQYTANLASTQQKPGSMHSVTLAQVFHKPDLFPTPVAADWKNGRPGDGYGPNLPKVTTDLMPTPKALDGVKGNLKTSQERLDSGRQVDLPNVAIDLVAEDKVKLFPTLRASDSYERRNQKTMDRIAKDGGDMTMTTLARTTTDWGKFEPAIRRWESILGRQAPEPTKPDGKDGNHRLSSKFTEWMMGLPDGWITGHNLKRNDELKLAGNGVVPQQAELALRLLLELPEREK